MTVKCEMAIPIMSVKDLIYDELNLIVMYS